MTNVDLLWVILALAMLITALNSYQSWALRRLLQDPKRQEAEVLHSRMLEEVRDLLQLTRGNAALAKTHTHTAEQAAQDVRTAVAPFVDSSTSNKLIKETGHAGEDHPR